VDSQAHLPRAVRIRPAGVAVAVATTLGLAAPVHAGSEHLDALMVQILPTPIPAPGFRLTDADGAPRTLEGFRGSVVLLNFWATWCIPCRDEMPAMERLHRAYRERGLTVLGVNFKESAREVRAFLEKLGVSFGTMLDMDGAVSGMYRVRGLPVTFLVDREGRLLWKAIGAREWDGPDGRAYLDTVLGGR